MPFAPREGLRIAAGLLHESRGALGPGNVNVDVGLVQTLFFLPLRDQISKSNISSQPTDGKPSGVIEAGFRPGYFFFTACWYDDNDEL